MTQPVVETEETKQVTCSTHWIVSKEVEKYWEGTDQKAKRNWPLSTVYNFNNFEKIVDLEICKNNETLKPHIT